MISKVLWNEGWEFGKNDYAQENKMLEPEQWKQADLPHDWLIYNTQELYKNTIGWYRKKFQYKEDGLIWCVRFEGVYMDVTIFINGNEIGNWKYGYSTFEFDITKYLVEGKNEIKIRVVHVAPNSRWYSGAGIYRNVWLLKRAQTHIAADGVYITPISLGEDWRVEIDLEVCVGETPIHYIHQLLLDEEGNLVASLHEPVEYSKLEIGAVQIFHQTMNVSRPKLWDIGKGNLYQLRTELVDRQHIIDLEEVKFGFRTISMDAEEGLFLNGKHIKIKGACEHHGFGCLGAVANKAAIKRKLEILRCMGVNAIRTAHNMPSVEFMELADEMGFLVNSEAFDMWGKEKTPYDYGRFFNDWVKKDVASWIRRDRNHPSIIMWSIGNEIYDLHEGEKGLEELRLMIQEVRKHDYKNHGKITFASNYLRWENTQKCADLVDLVGYNYAEDLYQKHHEEHPEWIIYGSETASMLASRNIYHFPLEKDILCEDNQQCSALGNCFAGWGAHDYLDNILADRDAKFSLGQFIWSGFDYFGEPTPYRTKNSYFGQIDTAGFPKDSYYIYQAEWTDYKEAPMIHIFPYWDFNAGQIVDICVCSNAPSIELFLNGRSFGCMHIDHENGNNLIPHWSIPYEEGELYAVAYDENQKIIAQDYRHSFGNACKLHMKPDKFELSAREDDLVFVEINAYDQDGYPVENANNRVWIEVTGAGRLVGIDNGDSTDFDQVKGKSKRLFGGKLLAVIAARGGCSGPIYIKAASCGIQGDELLLNVSEVCQRVTLEENQDYPVVAGGIGAEVIEKAESEIPIRKIELSCAEEPVFTKEKKTLTVKAKIEPSNATYKDLIWKVVNDTGIEIKLASLKIKGEDVTLTAKGDGEFYLRCIAMNGGTVASVRSSLLFRSEGFGNSLMSPYERICAGLFKKDQDGLSDGEDHGVRFLGKRDVYISCHDLDFGKYGTEEITLEIFKHTENPICCRIYLEEEDQAENQDEITLLANGVFEEQANWLEFKKQTYRLSQCICGIKRIRIASKDNFQLKSFQFVPICHGLQKIKAIEYSEIFGDSYQIKEQNITDIGNNVTLIYQDMDFGDSGVTKLIICGRSGLKNNSIHLKMEGETYSSYELIEFEGNKEYREREYTIKHLKGKAEIRFVFLPGSQFDFAWFQFK